MQRAARLPLGSGQSCSGGPVGCRPVSMRCWSRSSASWVAPWGRCRGGWRGGKSIDYPAIITLWRREPVPGQPGEGYFTRITVRYTGPQPPAYTSNGQLDYYPTEWTQSLGDAGSCSECPRAAWRLDRAGRELLGAGVGARRGRVHPRARRCGQALVLPCASDRGRRRPRWTGRGAG